MTRIATLTATLATVAALAWMLWVGSAPLGLYGDIATRPPAVASHG
jgi:hypothetical protein